MRWLILTYALFLTCDTALPGQHFEPVSVNPWQFTRLTKADGLAATGNVLDMLQDHQGFWWLATANGLQRFDGKHFKTFTHDPNNPTSLPSDVVLAVYMDDRNRLWVATAMGICTYDEMTGQFTPVRSDKGRITAHFPSRFFKDARGDLWFARSGIGGLFRYHAENDIWETIPATADCHLYGVIPGPMGPDGQSTLWFTYRYGLGFLQQPGGACRLSDAHPDAHPLFQQIGRITTLYLDSRQTLWVTHIPKGSDRHHLHTMDMRTGAIRRVDHTIKADRICFFEDAHQRLWFFSDKSSEFGYVNLQDGDKKLFRCIPGATNNPIFEFEGLHKIYGDSEGNIWLLSTTGLYVFNPDRQQIRPIEATLDEHGRPKPIAHVLSFFEASNGNIWVGTYFGGTYVFDQALRLLRTHQYPKSPPGTPAFQDNNNFNAVWSFAEDLNGRIWSGGQHGTVQLFGRDGSLVRKWQLAPPHNNTLRNLAADPEKGIWTGSQRGQIGQLNTKDASFSVFEREGPTEPVYQMELDGRHQLWINQNNQIDRFHTRSGRYERLLDNHPGMREDIFGFAHWDDSTLLAFGSALYWFDKNRLEYRSAGAQNTQSIRNITVAERDQSGRLWLGTHDGFFSWDARNNHIRRYHFHDGLPESALEFKDGKAGYRLKDGRMLFANEKEGFFYFHPDTLMPQPPPPDVVIVRVHASGDSLDRDVSNGTVAFSHADNAITVAYACLSWFQQPGLVFKYRLLGQSNDWIDNGDERKITLYGMAPGKYTLQLQVVNRFGLASPHITELRMHIRPPWWQSAWALLAYAALFAASTYQGYRYLLRRKLEKAEVQQVRELESFKSRFFENITHEFRTPLTVLNGVADLMQAQPATPISKYVKTIRTQTGRMLTLVNQLLDLSKLDSGFFKLYPQWTDMVQFMHHLCDNFQPLAHANGIRLDFHCPLPVLYAYIDPERLRQIADNLLSNALKCTPPGGSISCLLQQGANPNCARIQVTDTGIGIEKEVLPRVFDRFYQGQHAFGRPSEGTGLGLALARELALRMDGDLTVESIHGEGSTFTLEIPLSPPDAAHPTTAYIPTEERTHTDDEHAQRPSALIIEDNPDIARLLLTFLSDACDTQIATDGTAGLKAAIETVPDIIVSDIMMPGMDGLALTEALKTDIRTSHIPIILLTAKTGLENRLQGINKGADAYLEKPFNKSELLAIARQLLQSRILLRRHYMASVGLSEAPSNNTPAPLSDQENGFLRAVLDAIEQHLSHPGYSVEQLGADMLMSHSNLHRKIKAVSGLSPIQLIRSVKLQRAKAMLVQHPDMPVYAVAAACGFDDAAYFVRVFRQEFKATPLNWRNAQG